MCIENNQMPTQSIAELFDYIGREFQCDRIYIFERDAEGAYNCTEEWCKEARMHKKYLLQGFTWEQVQPYYSYFRRQKSLMIEDMDQFCKVDPELGAQLAPQKLRATMVRQLVGDGEDLGFIRIDNPAPEKYRELSVVFEIVAYYTALLVKNHRTIQQLERIGFQDRLTGCLNRHALAETVDRMVQGKALCVVYLEILHIREINEEEGYKSGDQVLRTAAQILLYNFGRERVYRIAGDEFLILSPGQYLSEFRPVLEHVRSELLEKGIEIALGAYETSSYQGDFTGAIQAADKSMYREKRRIHMKSAEAYTAATASLAFNELIEIHPQSDQYRLLYSEFSNNHMIHGKFYETVRRIAQTRIHPQDQADFIDFWKVSSVFRAFAEEPQKHSHIRTFRVNRTEDRWMYVTVEMIPFSSASGAPILMCMTKSSDHPVDGENGQTVNLLDASQSAEFFTYADQWLGEVQPLYVLTIACDLNNFKLFNDIFGRKAGDEYLQKLNSGLEQIAEQFGGIYQYLGGDNFCVMFAIGEVSEQVIVEHIENFIRGISFLEGFKLCVGVDISENLDEYASSRYDRALVALSNIKGSYSEQIAFFDDSSYQKMRRTQLLMMDAANGIREKEFVVYLQPKVEIATGRVIGAEALVRWMHNGTLLSPGAFIQGMEDNGYIVSLDRYVWEETCKWLNRLASSGLEPLPVSVNLSRIDMYFMDVGAFFSSLIDKYALKPEWLEIEITESAYSEQAAKLNELLAELRRKGFRILMDDFGSGYSSLNMLQDSEIDVLKLDRKFLWNGKSEVKNIRLMNMVFHMAEMLDLEIIVEGVETEEQCQMLLERGGKYCQGFYFYRPMPVKEFESLVWGSLER